MICGYPESRFRWWSTRPLLTRISPTTPRSASASSSTEIRRKTPTGTRIVGVVGNERMLHTSAPQPEIISHFAGDTPGTMRFALKTEVPPATLAETVRGAVAEIDGRIPFVAPRTMNEVAADALVRERFLMTLLGVFAVAALALAAVGVYGVAAQGARSRIKEIGIRLALGATGEQIVRRLVVRAGVFIGIGLVLGLAASAAAGQLIAGSLYGVRAR